jgi:HlyD family secretion protein
MNRKQILIASFFLILLLTVAGCNDDTQDAESIIRASGFVEGRSYTIISTLSGTVDLVHVDQGDQVGVDEEIVHLDDSTYLSVHDQVQAGVDAAEAGLNAVEEKPLSEELERGQAAVSISEAELEGALAALELLKSIYSPQDPPDAELHTAESAVSIAEAGVNLAKAQLNQIRAGPRDSERRMAQALLREAEAQLRLVERQFEELSVKSPTSGLVEEILVSRGETVTAGSPVARVLDPSVMTVKVYIPEVKVATLRIGDLVEVSADAYPEEEFSGAVLRIADEAQFTPTLVLTEEERVKLVFEVEIIIEEGLDKLKPGMPVDVMIQS